MEEVERFNQFRFEGFTYSHPEYLNQFPQSYCAPMYYVDLTIRSGIRSIQTAKYIDQQSKALGFNQRAGRVMPMRYLK